MWRTVPITIATATALAAAIAPATAAPPIPKPAHVVIVIEENHSYKQVNTQPYLTSLEKTGATFTNSHGITHPSEPNYLALWSGSTQGVHGDPCPVNLGNKPSLGGQINSIIYSEGLRAPGYLGCGGNGYARKHNPLADFTVTSNAAHNKPMTAFPKNFNQLAPVAVVVPNLGNDMHDGSVRTGDNWLKKHIAAYAAWAQKNNSVLIVTFDEDNGASGNQILTVITGQHIKPGRYPQPINHYNVLTTIEQAFGLPHLNKAAPITGIWK